MQENQPLDLSYLKEMVGNDPVFMIEIFDTFIEQTPIYLADLENALTDENWLKVGNCAHKIKPTFSYIGRSDVKDFMQMLEDKAKKQIMVEEIPADVEQLKMFLVEIYGQLELAKLQFQQKLSA